MKLKKGITGIWNIKDEPVKSGSNGSLFKASLYPIEYTGVFKIIEPKDDGIIKNYYRLSVIDKLRHCKFDVLINSIYPYYCGAASGTLNFIDLPIEIRTTADSNFTYLTPAELNSKFEKSDLVELSEDELKEIRYWKPKTFGEIVFNNYD